MTTYDLAVFGCGGMGSAVLYHAARTGARVIGLEQFSAVHNRGSSHGHTRIIRQAYFEHPHYVPLLLEAYQLWSELEQVVDERLYFETGLLQAGPADGIVVPGVLRSAQEHDLPIDRMTAQQAMDRFPMFRIPADHLAAFEYRAGYLMVEKCVEAHLRAAQMAGAEFRDQTRLEEFRGDRDGYLITTDQGPIRAQRIVITAGAWLPRWLDDSGMSLQILRKHLHWYQSSDPRIFQSAGCPLFFFENQVGCFYGFPAIDEKWGLKVAEHSGGEVIADPTQLDRHIDTLDRQRIDAFVADYFHGSHVHQRHDVCMYTMTPDSHFIIDTHPADDQLWIAGGFSGHGFKFASVIGKLVAHSALTNHRDPRLEFLKQRSTGF